jgi:hypothetical protein
MDQEILEPPVETPSLRETIEDAVDAQESSAGGSDPAVIEAKPAVEKPEGPVPPSSPAQPKPDVAKPVTDPAVPAATPGPTELKAPSQWKPAVREKWNQLPREVQEEILRREGDNLRLIGSVGQKIRVADELQNHLAPFVEKLQMNGANPSEFVGDIFTTVRSLAHGSPQEKAEVVANIVQSYGVDLRTLDQVLTGRVSAPPPDPRVVEAQRRAAFYENQVLQQQQMQEAQTYKGAEQTLTQFAADPKNEFFEDVRELMADLMEAGRASTLQDAYVGAVWAHPDTRKILLQREATQRAQSSGRRAQEARRASSAVNGAPRGPGVSANSSKPMSLRDTISAAMDAQEGI